jgi:hypothetical protein
MGDSRMINLFKRFVQASVFRKMPDDYTMSDIFAALFHRMAATLYLIYSGWAVLVLVDGVPSLLRQQGGEWTALFAVFVLLTTAPACFGATFFPKAARTELFSGFAFALMLLIYYYFLAIGVLNGTGSIAGFELLTSVIVMPICRTAIIIYFLLKQAKQRKELEGLDV